MTGNCGLRVLLVGENLGTRALIERLIGGSGHCLVWRPSASLGGLDGETFDLLLFDGASPSRDADQRLRACRLLPADSRDGAVFCFVPGADAGVPVIAAPPCSGGCGVRRTPEGRFVMRCRLQARALSEYRARDAGSRPAGGVLMFEYQGEAGEG